MSGIVRLLAIAGISVAVSACSSMDRELSDNILTEDAKVADEAPISQRLKQLPSPAEPVVLAVYRFDDKTGQHKPSDSFPEYSRAVTQGGGAILNKALYDAGKGSWFRVLEREGLNNLVQERKIIRATRMEYNTASGARLGDVGPLLYAGMLLEGGIVAYETNVITGGVGARYLGIGGDTQYRRDVVTVSLRAISVKTGEVILAVNTSKTIFSTLLRGGINKFVAIDELLEVESGFSLNEPPQFAVRQAIEMAVYSMVIEGSIKGLWNFADPIAGKRVVRDYVMKRDHLSEDDPQLPPSPDTGLTGVVPAVSAPVPNVPTVAPSQPVQAKPMVAPTPPARYTNPYRTTPPQPSQPLVAPTVKQLPKDATLNPNVTNGLPKAVGKPSDSDPQNIELKTPYRQKGVVYCGPSGCVPAYDAPPSAF